MRISLDEIIRSIPIVVQATNRCAFTVSQLFTPQATQNQRLDVATTPNFITTHNAPTAPWTPNFRHTRENRELVNHSFNADFEHLVKVKINQPLPIGTEVTINTNKGKLQYIVYRKIASEGLVSYALKPKEAKNPPLVVFRCSEINPFKEESFSSIQNDLSVNIGEKGWHANREAFAKLMEDPNFRGQRQQVTVAGYSLGGAYAQYFIAEHHQAVSHGIFYNNPSIDPVVADQFAQSIQNVHRDNPLILQIFRNIGDPVHHAGGKHLGCDIDHPNVNTQLLEIHFPNQDQFDCSLHSKLIFKTKTFDYTVSEYTNPEILSIKLNNSKRDPLTCIVEKIRHKSEGFLSGILNCLKSAWDWFWELFR